MAGIKERLIQVILRGKDLLSPEAKKSKEALDELRTSGEKLREELDKAKDDNNLVRSLSSLGKESERAQKTADRTAAKVVELRDELNKNPDSKGLSQSLKDAEREAEKAQKALDALKVKTTDLTTAAKAAGIDTRKLSDEEKRLAAELDKAKGAVADNTKATKDLEQEQRRAARAAAEQGARTTSLGNVLKSAERKVLGYAAAYISLRAATNLVKKGLDLVRSGIESVISVGDGAEKSKIQLEGLMGSIAGGEQATAWIEEFADKSGQRINDVREAFADLKAYGLDPMDGSMQAIMDTTARLGGETEKLKGISLGIGQMWAKEKIVQEEVNQLRERGVNVYALLSKAMNKNVSELQDMAKAGQLGRKEIKLLIDEMGRSAEGQASRSLETLSGKWNLLRNQFQKFGEEVASHGAMDIVKEKLQGVIDKIVGFSADGTLDKLAKAIGIAFEVAVDKVDEFVRSLGEIDFKTIADDSSKWLGDFEEKINSSITAVTRLTAPVRVLANVITGFGAAALTAFSAVVFGSLSLLSVLAKAIPDMFGGDTIVKGLEGARDSVKEMMGGLAKQVSTDFNDIKSAVNDLMGTTADAAGEAAAAVSAAEGLQLAALKKSYAERKISIDEYIKGLDTIKLRLSELTQVSQTEHESALEQLETLYQTSHKIAQQRAEGLLSDESHAAAQANLQAAIEQVKSKVDETSESFKIYSDQLKETQESIAATSKTEQESIKTKAQLIQELRDEQKRLGEQFFADKITQEEWEAGHNSANEAIRELGKSVEETVVKISSLQEAEEAFTTASTVSELEAFKKALFDAYSNEQIDLENFQRLHNQASLAIRELGGSSVKSARDLTTLDGVMKEIAKSANSIDTRAAQVALDKLYKESKIDAEQHKKAQEELNQKIAELKPAAEKSTKAVKEQSEALQEATGSAGRASGAVNDAGDAARKASASFEWFTGMLNQVREPLEQMSDAAVAAFNKLQGITTTPEIDTSSLSGVGEALQRVREETGRLEIAMANTFGGNISDTLSRWATQTKLNGKEVEASYLGQKESLLSLMQTINSGGLSLEYLSNMAGDASARFDLLSESDLSPLIAAANQAKEAMKAFSDSTQSTVDNLRMELLQLQGTEEEIAKARAEQRRNELKSQLAMAEKNNDKESIARLHEALGLLNKIESEQVNRIRTTAEEKAAEAQRKEQEAQQKEQDAAQREADNARKKLESEQQAKARELEKEKEAKTKTKEKDSAARPTVGQQYQQPAAGSPIVTRVIRIESRSGQGVDLGIRSASDEIKLLSVLEDAGLRSM